MEQLLEATQTQMPPAVVAATTETPPAVTPPANGSQPAQQTDPAATPAAKTIMNGADPAADDKTKEEAAKPYWPEDWREKMARQASGEDEKAYKKELNRLQRFADPTGVYGFAREYESKFDRGGLVKMPGKDAKPEEVSEFQKALGWSEKPGEMFSEIQLENGTVIGEMDKPMVSSFLEDIHGATNAQQVVSKAVNWWYKQQEAQAAELDKRDDEFLRTSTRELKDEYGPRYERMINNIASLHRFHPRGKEGFEEMVAGRDAASSNIIANNPELVRMFVAMAQEVNPVGSVVEDSAGGIQSVQGRLAEIQKMRTAEPKRYWSNEIQSEELKLIEVIQKEQNRARA
jgi:hypothetical protein